MSETAAKAAQTEFRDLLAEFMAQSLLTGIVADVALSGHDLREHFLSTLLDAMKAGCDASDFAAPAFQWVTKKNDDDEAQGWPGRQGLADSMFAKVEKTVARLRTLSIKSFGLYRQSKGASTTETPDDARVTTLNLPRGLIKKLLNPDTAEEGKRDLVNILSAAASDEILAAKDK